MSICLLSDVRTQAEVSLPVASPALGAPRRSPEEAECRTFYTQAATDSVSRVQSCDRAEVPVFSGAVCGRRRSTSRPIHIVLIMSVYLSRDGSPNIQRSENHRHETGGGGAQGCSTRGAVPGSLSTAKSLVCIYRAVWTGDLGSVKIG